MRNDPPQPDGQHATAFRPGSANCPGPARFRTASALPAAPRRSSSGSRIAFAAADCPRRRPPTLRSPPPEPAPRSILTSVDSLADLRALALRHRFQLHVAALPASPPLADRTPCPTPHCTTFIASSSGSARRYCRSDASASRQSTADRMRAPIGISSPFRPSGYPCHPISRDARARSAPPDRGTAPAPESPRPPPDGSSSFRTLPASACRASR